MKKKQTPKPETRYYTKWQILNRANKRGERRPIEGALAKGLVDEKTVTVSTLAAVRSSREKLDSLHAHVLDLTPRLRNLCWAIDAQVAANLEAAEAQS